MKALSLWQPYATLIAIGAKQYETRSWSTDYRGPLVIHAAKSKDSLHMCLTPRYARALSAGGIRVIADLPLGAALCVVDLVDVFRTEEIAPSLSEDEIAFGNFFAGRYAWKLTNIRLFPKPEPYRGAQQLFEYTGQLPEGVSNA